MIICLNPIHLFCYRDKMQKSDHNNKKRLAVANKYIKTRNISGQFDKKTKSKHGL